MTTLLPTSQSTGVETYEDMFKEITRKLYGDESAHGLYPHNTQVAQLAPGAPSAPPDGGERSFTTLTQIGYETTTTNQPSASSSAASQQQQQQQQQQQEHLTTAFGLAALMQNGFPPPGTMLNPVNFPGASKTPTNISIPSTDDRWQSHQPGDDHPWNGGKHSSPSGYGGSKAYKKPKTEPHDATGAAPTGLNIPSTVDRTAGKGAGYAAAAAATSPTGVIKRYSCTSCPYTTDRRDLFTRHENIHKDEKPFQCYACLKPFNRADHVKKHFLRMHRELEYDIAKTRRHPPGGGSGGGKGGTYYGASSQTGGVPTATSSSSSSSSSSSGGGGVGNATTAMTLAQMQLNIPSGSFSNAPSLVVPSHTLDGGSAHLNGSHQAQLLQLHSHHQQQQLQQQQQHHHQQSHANLHPAQLAIKQEKGSSGSLNTSANSAGGSPDDKYAKKIKGEKKFACTYCPWAGADNWGLKRHLNTHTKPYVCLLCDYKAARSERLATHVLKVHNKKACSKCNFFAEDQAQLEAHLQEAHLLHMQAVGRNKASVTQDFRNAGGGDNNGGDAGDSSSSSSSSTGTSAAASPYALSMAAAAAIERQMKKKHHGADAKASAASHDSVNLSLASLFGGDQLSFLQLLATAAVAHQQLQLHSSQQQQQQPYLQPHHHQQQKKQQHQKPSKAVDHHHVGASNGGRYGSTMVSSPPATSTQQQHQQQQPPRATNSTGTAPHSTNGNGATVPLIDPQYQQLQPLALDMGSMKKRRTASSASSAAAANSASSSDKENSIVHRNRINGGSAGTGGTAVPQQQQCNGTAAVVIVPNGASAILNGGVTDKHNTPHKNGHHHHHHHHYNPHHHNNNNSSTSNKNINDIFDKVYKKPQNSLNASKQPQPAAHSLAATILRTAPPSAVEEDNRREADAARQDTAPSAQAEQFSLTEFLKSHTEVSISTVGGKGAEDESPVTIIPLPLVADRQQLPEMKETEEQQKVPLEGERNPRKRYQPRRIGESDELPDPPPSDDPMAFVAVEMLDTSMETASKSPEPKEQAEEQQQQQQEGKAIDLKVQKQATPTEKPQATVSRLADIRDKHMIKLITNRRCCRICRTSGLLDHLDNAHYHSRMSLFLHTLWRHRRSSAGMCECRKCGAQFARRYMLVLHQKLTKHTGMVVQADSGSKRVSKRATKRIAIKKSSSSSKHVAGARKQRKRKPRSRCFTAKRKK